MYLMCLKAEELSMVVTKSTPLRNSFKHCLLYILGQVLYPVWSNVYNQDHWPHCTCCIDNIYIYIYTCRLIHGNHKGCRLYIYLKSRFYKKKLEKKNLPSLDFVNLIITSPFCSDLRDYFCVLLTLIYLYMKLITL